MSQKLQIGRGDWGLAKVSHSLEGSRLAEGFHLEKGLRPGMAYPGWGCLEGTRFILSLPPEGRCSQEAPCSSKDCMVARAGETLTLLGSHLQHE